MPFGIEVFGRTLMKRGERGLYAGRRVLSGNKISDDGGNKSRRKWKPNVQQKKLFSDTLGLLLPIRVTTGALRNIDKAGGLDRYLTKIEGSKEDSWKAEQLRKRLKEHTELERMKKLSLEAAASKPTPAPPKAVEKKTEKKTPRLKPRLMRDPTPDS